MNCSFDKEKLSGYYDGELAAGEKAEVERHIASCSECLRDLGEIKSAALLVKELPRLRAPRSIAEGVSREIQAAGKVRSLARVRRFVLWSAAAAAGLFVVANVVMLSSSKRNDAPAASERMLAQSAPRPVAAEAPMEPPAPKPVAVYEKGADRNAAPEARRELRKNVEEAEEKRIAGAPAEEKPGNPVRSRSEPTAPVTPKPSEPLAKADAVPAAPAATPAPAPAAPKTAAPAAVPDAGKAESAPFADKDRPAKEPEAAAKAGADPHKQVASGGAPAELQAAQFNVLAKDLAKARPRIEDSLKRMGVTPQPAKQPRSRDAENTLVLELTDAQLLRLREELEKPGDARLVAVGTVEPVLPGFRGGGLFAKKDPTAAGKAPPAAKESKEKDAREADDAAAGPHRKVTLHLIESKSLQSAEGETAPPQKN